MRHPDSGEFSNAAQAQSGIIPRTESEQTEYLFFANLENLRRFNFGDAADPHNPYGVGEIQSFAKGVLMDDVNPSSVAAALEFLRKDNLFKFQESINYFIGHPDIKLAGSLKTSLTKNLEFIGECYDKPQADVGSPKPDLERIRTAYMAKDRMTRVVNIIEKAIKNAGIVYTRPVNFETRPKGPQPRPADAKAAAAAAATPESRTKAGSSMGTEKGAETQPAVRESAVEPLAPKIQNSEAEYMSLPAILKRLPNFAVEKHAGDPEGAPGYIYELPPKGFSDFSAVPAGENPVPQNYDRYMARNQVLSNFLMDLDVLLIKHQDHMAKAQVEELQKARDELNKLAHYDARGAPRRAESGNTGKTPQEMERIRQLVQESTRIAAGITFSSLEAKAAQAGIR